MRCCEKTQGCLCMLHQPLGTGKSQKQHHGFTASADVQSSLFLHWGFTRDRNPTVTNSAGHKPRLKIMYSFSGICLSSQWCTVIPSTATHTDSRTLTRSLVFSGWRARSVYGEIPEITCSIELLMNKEENWHSRISLKFLGLQSSHSVYIFHTVQNNVVKASIYRAMLWRGLKQKSWN